MTEPLVKKLPESNSAPASLTIKSDSPVKRASFASARPDMTCKSAGICSPAPIFTKSPNTSSLVEIDCSLPSRITSTSDWETIDNFRTRFLACIS